MFDVRLPEVAPAWEVSQSPVRAFLLSDTESGKLYLAFGETCVDAAKKLGGDIERFSVGGTYEIDEPICVSDWWPYFTCNPGRHRKHL